MTFAVVVRSNRSQQRVVEAIRDIATGNGSLYINRASSSCYCLWKLLYLYLLSCSFVAGG